MRQQRTLLPSREADILLGPYEFKLQPLSLTDWAVTND